MVIGEEGTVVMGRRGTNCFACISALAMLYLQGAGTLFPAQLQVGDGTGEEGVTALGHT